jgi:hypothetical protein
LIGGLGKGSRIHPHGYPHRGQKLLSCRGIARTFHEMMTDDAKEKIEDVSLFGWLEIVTEKSLIS